MIIPDSIYFDLRDAGLWLTPLRAVLLDDDTELASTFMQGKSITGFSEYKALPVQFDNPNSGTADTLRIETSTGVLVVEYTFTGIVTTGASIRISFTDDTWISYDGNIGFFAFVLDRHDGIASNAYSNLIDRFIGGFACGMDVLDTGEVNGIDMRSKYMTGYGDVEFADRIETERAVNAINAPNASVLLPMTVFDTGEISAVLPPILESGTLDGAIVADIAPVIVAERISDTQVKVSLLNPIQGYSVRLYVSTVQASTYGLYELDSGSPYDLEEFPVELTLPSGVNYKFKATYIASSAVSPQSDIRIVRGYTIT